MNHILEIELSWGKPIPYRIETDSFVCEELNCTSCEFRFACYTTSDVVIGLERTFDDYHTAMKYQKKLRKKFPRSNLYD